MGLVDYDSDGSGSSDGEATVAAPPSKTTTTTTATTAGGKKPFQKLVDRANPGKILVSLPSAAETKDDDNCDGRPAKRAKVGGGGSRFSGFGSFLPLPKKTGAAAAAAAPTVASLSKADSPSTSSASPSAAPSTSRPGVNLKTSSEAAFSRRDKSDSDALPGSENSNTTKTHSSSSSSSRMALPPPKAPSIPKDQKAAEDVKLVGNPLMFMPLSVSRKPGGKKKKPAGGAPASAGSVKQSSADGAPNNSGSATPPAAPPPKKKVSLFSLGADDQAEVEKASAAERAAEDAAEAAAAAAQAESAATDDYQSVDYSSTYQPPSSGYGYAGQQGYYGEDPTASSAAAADTTSLNAFADNMHLSAKERRELFGRTGSAAASVQIAATFNMDQEYRHNEQMRQAEEGAAQNGGQQQSHNPVRTLMPGKHSLRQLVNQVHTQQDALEETFAKNRQSQREAGGKYGWR